MHTEMEKSAFTTTKKCFKSLFYTWSGIFQHPVN